MPQDKGEPTDHWKEGVSPSTEKIQFRERT